MIEVKQAVAAARNAATEFFEDAPLNDLQLEEVEYDEQSSTWLITLGFNVKSSMPLSGTVIGAAIGMSIPSIRKYKTFHIDGETGAVKSMKIRTV